MENLLLKKNKDLTSLMFIILLLSIYLYDYRGAFLQGLQDGLNDLSAFPY